MEETWYFDNSEKVVDWDQVLATGRTDRDIMVYTGEPTGYRKMWGTLNRFANSAVSASAVQRMKSQQSTNPLPPYRKSKSANVSGPTTAQLEQQVTALVGIVANASSAQLVQSIQEQQAALAAKDQQVQARISDLTNVTTQLNAFALDYQSRVAESVQDRQNIHTQLNTLSDDVAKQPPPPDLTPYAKKTDIPQMPDMSTYAHLSDIPVVPPLPDMSVYLKRSELPTAPDLSGFALKTDLPSMPDLSPYARKSDIPSPVDLTSYAKKADIPSSPDLSPYLKRSELPTAPDLSGYALKTDIPTVPAAPDLTTYAKKADIPSLTNYALKSDIPAAPDLTIYAKKSDLATINDAIANLQSKKVQQDFQVINTVTGLTLTTNTYEIAVTWATAFPDTNYAIMLGLSVSSVSVLGKFTAVVKQGSKSKTGCTLTVSGGGIVVAAGQTIEVLAFRYGTV